MVLVTHISSLWAQCICISFCYWDKWFAYHHFSCTYF